MGEYAKAEPLSRQSLQIRKQALGEKHPDYATSLDNLATLHEDLGDYGQADLCFLEALEIRKAALGEKHPEYATSLDNLAALYKTKGAFRKAEPFYREALQIRKDTLGEQHPMYATSLCSLAGLYTAMGDYNKAEPLYHEALKIRKDTLGEQHPDYAASLTNLAGLYISIDEFAKAEPLYLQALEIRKNVLGVKHPDYASGLNGLARLYSSLGDNVKAEPLFQQGARDSQRSLRRASSDLRQEPAQSGSPILLDGGLRESGTALLAGTRNPQTDVGRKSPVLRREPGFSNPLYYLMGAYAKAEPLSRQALQISRDELDLTAAIQSERQQLRMASNLSRFLDDYLSIAQSAKMPAAIVYADVLAWKGAVSARQQSMRRLREAIADGKLVGGAAIFDELTQRSRELSNRMAVVPEPGHEEEHRRSLADLNSQVERLEQSLAAPSGDFHRELAERKRTPLDIQSCLPADAVLVDLLEYSRLSTPAEKGKKASQALAGSVRRAAKPADRVDRPGTSRADCHSDRVMAAAARSGSSAPRANRRRGAPSTGLGQISASTGRREDGSTLSRWRDRSLPLAGIARPAAGHLFDRRRWDRGRANPSIAARALGDERVPAVGRQEGGRCAVVVSPRRRQLRFRSGHARSAVACPSRAASSGTIRQLASLAAVAGHADGNGGDRRFVRGAVSRREARQAAGRQSHERIGDRGSVIIATCIWPRMASSHRRSRKRHRPLARVPRIPVTTSSCRGRTLPAINRACCRASCWRARISRLLTAKTTGF